MRATQGVHVDQDSAMKAQVPFFNAIQDGFLQRTALQIVDLVQQLPDQRAGDSVA